MRVAVVGAGLAGLAAGCELADLGHSVTVFERRPWAGGKTYSFADRETGEAVDNGQHVFMACTTEYVRFLERLGTLRLTRRQRRLRVPVFDQQGRRSDIRARGLRAPFHLAESFIAYRHLGPGEKLRIGRLMASIGRMPASARDELGDVAFGAWLRERGQTDEGIRRFWDFMLVPTLNARADEVSADAALFVLQEGFLKSAEAAALGVPAAGLSALHVDPAVAYIEARGGQVRTGAGVEAIVVEGERVAGIETAGGSERYDAVVCAVPHRAVARLLPMAWRRAEPFVSLAAIPVAPIVNLHFWFDRPVMALPFAAFAEGDLQWVFNRPRIERRAGAGREHLVVSLSAAQRWMGLDKRELEEHFLREVARAFPLAREAKLLHFAAIKEPEATFVPAPGIRRPRAETPIGNLYLAGAYTATGWPATMESAVRSGLAAARAVHSQSCRRVPETAQPEGR